MFSGNRRFDGRQGEQILNQEQYILYEILKHFLDIPNNPDPYAGPQSDLEKPGALWLDRQTSPGYGHVMYRDNDKTWKPLYDDWFKLIKEIRKAEGEPENPLEGQLWINDSGVLHWFNGSVFVPIKSSLADTVDFNYNSFQNFLLIDPLKMSGGYIIENLSKLAQMAGGIELWQKNNLYHENDIVFYTFEDGRTAFYRSTKEHVSELNFTDELINKNIEPVELKAQYLIPSEVMDKLFIDGIFAEKDNVISNEEDNEYTKTIYERISDVCIQISLNVYDGKTIAAVHVNPIALKNIVKRIIKIEKDQSKYNEYAMIKVGPQNTEYYGFKGNFGQLLMKGEDYIQKANGIQLIKKLDPEQEIIEKCDFDKDGVVSELDYEELCKYANDNTDPDIVAKFDLNNDGIVDIKDISLFSKYLNSVVTNPNAINDYDFIYCVTYEFEDRIKTQGLLYKNSFNLSNKVSVWIGELELTDKLLVFTEGLCLEEFFYEYNPATETVDFNGYDENGNATNDINKISKSLFKDLMNVAILRFNKKTTIGVLTQENLDNEIVNEGETQYYSSETDGENKTIYIAKVPIPKDYKQPLIFIQGVNLNFKLKDYTIENGYAVIKDVFPGRAYYIVDAVRNDNFNMYVDQGVVDDKQSIVINDPEILDGNCTALIFIDGIYISTRDLYYSDYKTIKINGLKSGQEYVVLKDKNDKKYQLLYDGLIKFSTITLENSIDDALVYITNQLIIDNNSCVANSFVTDNIVNNEIKLITSENNGQQWYYFDSTISSDNGEIIDGKWIKLEDDVLVNTLELASSGYTVDNRTINILQNYADMNCTYYAYRFADNIEKPLIKGYSSDFIELENEIFCKLENNHYCTPNVNALHVWLNGSKQKVIEDKYYQSMVGYTKEYQGFRVSRPTDAYGNYIPLDDIPAFFYIIEEPEEGESKACMQEYLTDSIGASTFTTNNILLTPGIPRVFIDGYRQPSGSYIINNANTLTMIEPIITENTPTITFKDFNSKDKFIDPSFRSNILIEVRQDYSFKEKTVRLTLDNIENLKRGATFIIDRSSVFDNNQKFPVDLFTAQSSEICIYINGAAYGNGFNKIKNQDIIVLNNGSIIEILKPGDYITIEWR